MDVLVVNQLRAGACLRRCCGFSTPARSGICCRKDYVGPKTVHRRFRLGVADKYCHQISQADVANELRNRGVFDEEECFIDATFVMAKGGGAEIRTTKRGKGLKIMAIVDRHGFGFRSARMRQTITKFAWCSSARLLHDRSQARSLIGDGAEAAILGEERSGDMARMIDSVEVSTKPQPPTRGRRRTPALYATLAHDASSPGYDGQRHRS